MVLGWDVALIGSNPLSNIGYKFHPIRDPGPRVLELWFEQIICL